jgi:fumarate hydratase subunit beta
MKVKRIRSPIEDKNIKNLKSGDFVLITGIIYTARDLAHKKLVELINRRKNLPVDLKNAIIYYTGPTPAKPGQVIGSIGPTTSSRMDIYTPVLIRYGLKGMIGKGERSKEVLDAIKKYKSIYFATIGGTGALLSEKVIFCEPVAFQELGPEAIYKLKVKDFPAIVINDTFGNDFYRRNRN